MLCPKCREPIEGPEMYICCGTDTLAWRCRDCAKVSEGFAFPYGRCPHCDGVLETHDRRNHDDQDELEAIRIAFEIELGGQAFYQGAQEAEAEPDLRALFAGLAEMEGEHLATLSRRYRISAPPAAADENAARSALARAAIYGGIERQPGDPLALLRIAIACEERAARFFADESQRMSGNNPSRQIYRELAAEERDHAALLATELERRRIGKPGLL